MGVSTDAMLVYGYVWDDDEYDLLGNAPEVDDDVDDEKWQEVIAKRRGHRDPWDAYPHDELNRMKYDERQRASRQWMDAHKAEIDAWYEVRKQIAAEYGVDIDRHGSGEWSCPIVKITGAGHTAARGYPWQLTADNLAVDPSWDAKLQRFIDDLGIDVSDAQGPGWFLASYWSS